MDSIYFPVQRHTDRIHVLESDLKPIIADAVLTEKKGVLIGVQVADCVPVLLYDVHNSVIGAVHAGWRGTAGEILRNTINVMKDMFRSSAKDILIAMGPSIRQCCYEVGDDVMTAIRRATGKGTYCFSREGRCFIDLLAANRIQALSTGIPEDNIWHSGECTCCNPDRFYSYRFTKGHAGRQCGFIGVF